MNIIRFPFWILLATIVCITGCATKNHDPLTGWTVVFSKDIEKLDPAILNDFQSYVIKLSTKEKTSAKFVDYFKDGTGQHALKFEVPVNGTDWAYVLIYNKENKRVKVLKYISHYYSS